MSEFRCAAPWSALMLAGILASGYAAAQEQRSLSASVDAVSSSGKALTVVGKVGNEGRTLLTDIDSEWTVSNPELLKAYEGRKVTVRCYVDSRRNKVQILFVHRDNGELRVAAQRQDSAFRR
ncbi:MAG TPA: hypothetical protein VFO39_10360 [Candidatus Sulfotelmatobacter sp.]|nr:hypothetical protein [Candidatus Sulfotelmatobacter sp.]